MLYFSLILHPSVRRDEPTREATLKGGYHKGTHEAGDASVNIISYACKLYKDGMTKMGLNRTNAYDAPYILERGQSVFLQKYGWH